MIRKIFYSIKAIFTGIFTVFKHLFKKPISKEYPEVKPNLGLRFRGKHTLNNCTACGYCQKVCPTNAISIEKSERGLEKYQINLQKCIFCGNCMYYCPTKSMNLSREFELATDVKSDLMFVVQNVRNLDV